MRPTARFSNKGFTLIEVMVALTILVVAMMGILGAMVLAMQQNLENYSRDESVRIAEQTMNELRDADFATLTSGTSTVNRTYKQRIRSFTVSRTVAQLSANSRSVQIQVSWSVNGKVHNHSVTSILSRGI